jgi:hypothetical protein
MEWVTHLKNTKAGPTVIHSFHHDGRANCQLLYLYDRPGHHVAARSIRTSEIDHWTDQHSQDPIDWYRLTQHRRVALAPAAALGRAASSYSMYISLCTSMANARRRGRPETSPEFACPVISSPRYARAVALYLEESSLPRWLSDSLRPRERQPGSEYVRQLQDAGWLQSSCCRHACSSIDQSWAPPHRRKIPVPGGVEAPGNVAPLLIWSQSP